MCALAAGHLLEVEGSRGADQVAELPEAEKAGIEEGVVLERPGAPWPKVPLPSYWTTTVLIQLGCWTKPLRGRFKPTIAHSPKYA